MRPSKPAPSSAPTDELLSHYNATVPAYNAAVAVLAGKKTRTNHEPMSVIEDVGAVPREELIELIRRQNRRLGRTVRRRALELLEERIKGPDGRPQTDADGRSVGLKYLEVLAIIHREFPESSTSVACLRWYVVQLRSNANEQGLPWPDLPQVRPRSTRKKAEAPCGLHSQSPSPSPSGSPSVQQYTARSQTVAAAPCS